MGKTSLVDEDRRSGRLLIDALREAGVPIRAAMWLRLDGGDYRLYLASPLVQRDGPLETNARINEVLSRLGDKISFTKHDALAINTTNHFVNTLASLYAPHTSDAYEVHDVELSEADIKHAYIYRVEPDSDYPASGSNQKPRRATGKKKRAKQHT